MFCINSYSYGEKHYSPWKLSHSCSHDISPSTVTLLARAVTSDLCSHTWFSPAGSSTHGGTHKNLLGRLEQNRQAQAKPGQWDGVIKQKTNKQTTKTKPKESEPWILSLSPPAAARSLHAIRAPRAQIKCQGIPMHDALNSCLPYLV